MIKLLIADDQQLIRDSLKIVLDTNDTIEVIGAVSNGVEVIRAVRENRPDVVLMDIRMPEMDGVQCTQIIKENYPEIKIIILTTFDDDEYIFSALKYGASGYLLKGISMEQLVEAIHKVYKGNAMINGDIATKVLDMFSKMAQNDISISVEKGAEKEITESEWKVVRLVAEGMSNKEIATKLYLTEGSVRNYLSSILRKLDLRDRTQLAIWAVQTGALKKEVFVEENRK
ncbi:MAG: response regulator transcription factor [Lachnospiraceae bacterium]|nr:response regulator transcription factor [Candidatus Colinaster equi]